MNNYRILILIVRLNTDGGFLDLDPVAEWCQICINNTKLILYLLFISKTWSSKYFFTDFCYFLLQPMHKTVSNARTILVSTHTPGPVTNIGNVIITLPNWKPAVTVWLSMPAIRNTWPKTAITFTTLIAETDPNSVSQKNTYKCTCKYS